MALPIILQQVAGIPFVLGHAAHDAPAGPTTEESYASLFGLYLTIALVVGVTVTGWLIVALVRYRDRPGQSRNESDALSRDSSHRGHPLMFGLMAVVIAGILFATMLGTVDTVDQFEHPPEGKSLSIDVVGFQFAWEFRYPHGFKTIGELVVPVDTIILLNLTSRDVIHKFQLSDFKVGKDATPGHVNHLWFRPTRTGTYPARCAELCGLNHAVMRANVVVLPPDEFAAWIRAQAEGETPGLLTQEAEIFLYDDLVQPSLLDTLVGMRLRLHVTNAGNQARAFSIDSPANTSTALLEPGASAWLNMTVEESWLPPGQTEVSVPFGSSNTTDRTRGLQGRLLVRLPRTIEASLDEWSLTLSDTSLVLDETVRIRFTNEGTVPHDLTVGTWSKTETEKRIRWRSRLVDPGETADLLVRPDMVGAWDAWCEVPGHAQIGMRASLKVSDS